MTDGFTVRGGDEQPISTVCGGRERPVDAVPQLRVAGQCRAAALRASQGPAAALRSRFRALWPR
ncbi:hypothetical protein [Streptomyces sp. G44]|uniref:hypothetical protein n=1 Tax=Streptomyces sp. G44 TaxID=2807632 RepID=UPI001960BDC8|nr:hypothetical protein [Streptomyces sp. G44]